MRATAYSEPPLSAEQIEASRREDESERNDATVVTAIILSDDRPTGAATYVIPASEWTLEKSKSAPYDFGVIVVRYGHSYQMAAPNYRYWRPNPFDWKVLKRGVVLANGFHATQATGYFVKRTSRMGSTVNKYFVILAAAPCRTPPDRKGRCKAGKEISL